MIPRTENISPPNWWFILALGSLILLGGCSKSSPWKNTGGKSNSKKKVVAYAWAVELLDVQKEGIKSTSSFRDDWIDISFEVMTNLVSVQFKNVSPENLYIIWNDCYFEFPGGIRSRIIHSEVEFERRDKPLMNEYIYPGVSEARYIAPRSRVDWNRVHKKWRSFPLLKGNMKKLPGSRFSFNLFIHKGDTVEHYPFVFEVLKTFPVKLEKRDNKIYQSPYDPDPRHQKTQPVDTGVIAEEKPPVVDSAVKAEVPVKKPDKKPPEKPGDTNVLLEKMKAEKSRWEEKEQKAKMAEQALRDSLDRVRRALMRADSLRYAQEEQHYIDTLSKPENIPLFEEEEEENNAKSK